MKRLLFLCSCIFLLNVVNAQIKNPVHWTFAAKKTKGSTYEVRLTATIDRDWHMYSQTTPDGGPIKTTVSFSKNPLLTVNGEVREVGKMEQKHEELFGVDVKQFSNKVEFVQLVDAKTNAKTSLSGSIEYMTCNDKECLPPTTQKFVIPLQ